MKYVITALFFFLSLSINAQEKKIQHLTLALNWKAEPEFGGFYAAELNGEFKKRDLEVDIQEGGSGTPTIQMLANGKVDFAIVSGDEILVSLDRNPKVKIRALFAVYQIAPYMIMSHQQNDFKSIKDVFQSNNVLAIQTGLPFYQFLVNKYGKPKAKIVPYLGGIGNFVNSIKFSQQGFITTEPLSAKKAGKKVTTFLVADEGFNPYTVVVATTEKMILERPKIINKFTSAITAGWAKYLKNPEPTNSHILKLNKTFDLDTLNEIAKVQESIVNTEETKKKGLGSMTDQRWVTLKEQLVELKLVKSNLDIKDVRAR